MIPHREARIIVAGLLHDLFRHTLRTYRPDMAFLDAVTGSLICAAILSAEARGKPATDSDLARTMGMPRSTLYGRLAMLVNHQFISRKRDGWHINRELLASAKGETAIRETCRVILAAADALSKIGTA